MAMLTWFIEYDITELKGSQTRDSSM